MGGMKQRLMAQAAAAQNNAAENNEETGVVDDGSDDALWKVQEEILKPDNLTADLELQYQHEAETENPSKDEDISSSRFKFQTSLDKQFVFDFKTASPRENICKIDWASECKGVQRSEAGAEGVFFVSTTTGAVVVKGSRSIAPEMFSCMLGIALGVYCPRWRLIGTSSTEGKVLMRSLISLDPSGRIQTSIGAQTHVLLKAFLPGQNFGSIGERRANEIFGVPGRLSDNGKTRLRELGRVLALDVLCNNGDRFPLIWDNRGNPGNVMMANGLGKSVSIDSQIQTINGKQHPNELETYLQKVRVLNVALSENGGEQGLPQFMNVCAKLTEFSQRVFAETEALELQRGYRDVTTNKATFSITRERLERWQTALSSYTPALVGMQGIDVEFVLKVWQCM